MGCTDKICKNCRKWHITYECPMVYGLGYCDEFAPKTIEKTTAPIKWIDIKDELPSNGAQVLVTVCEETAGGFPYIYTDVGMRCEEYWFVDNELNDNVTHWAKLPQPAERNRA